MWLAQQLQSELQSLQAASSKVQEQSQGQDQNGSAGSSPDMTALLQLRRQISAYQVTTLAQIDCNECLHCLDYATNVNAC